MTRATWCVSCCTSSWAPAPSSTPTQHSSTIPTASSSSGRGSRTWSCRSPAWTGSSSRSYGSSPLSAPTQMRPAPPSWYTAPSTSPTPACLAARGTSPQLGTTHSSSRARWSSRLRWWIASWAPSCGLKGASASCRKGPSWVSHSLHGICPSCHLPFAHRGRCD